MKTKLLTEEMFLEGKWNLKEPEILSRRDERFKRKHTRSITTYDVKTLCEILQYPKSEIFGGDHVDKIISYCYPKDVSITVRNKEYHITHRIKNVLLDVYFGVHDQNEVIHDISRLLSKDKPDELTLKVQVYNHLIGQGYMHLNVPKND